MSRNTIFVIKFVKLFFIKSVFIEIQYSPDYHAEMGPIGGRINKNDW
jgi:hypothetical protein